MYRLVSTHAIPHASSSLCRLSQPSHQGFGNPTGSLCGCARQGVARSCAKTSLGERADGTRSMKHMVRVSDVRANAHGHALRSQLEQQHTGRTGPMDGTIDSHRSLTDQYMREYERLQVARKQRFLGAPLHFHPLDAFVYQQILYEVRPDLVVITGDVIGGTCLFTAFWLEVLNPDANVLLIDPLTLSDAVMNKVPNGAKNPEAYPYWRTRVIPLMGDPLEEHILTSVSEYVGNASKVLVMLGSSIDSREVKHHLNAFHRFVSEDSYLIVQDTFHGNAVVATKAFLSERKGYWISDQQRELLLVSKNHHGWLKRLPLRERTRAYLEREVSRAADHALRVAYDKQNSHG